MSDLYRDTDWDNVPTPPLPEFCEEYEKDSNLWWVIGSGHGMNLFDAALEEIERLKGLLREAADVIDGLSGQQAMPDDWFEEPLVRIREAGDKA